MSKLELPKLLQAHEMMVQSFHDFVADLREEGPEEETEGLSSDFLEHFKLIIKSKTLDQFSPIAFYWVNLIDNLIYVLQMWQDGDDEGLTDFWTESEYAQAYMDLANEGEEPTAITEKLMPLLEGQVLGFYHWHISAHHKAKENPTLHQLVPDIGDHDLGIRIGEKHMVCPPDSHPDSPALPFWNKSFSDGMVSIDDDDGELVGGMQELETLNIGNKVITLKGATPDLDKKLTDEKMRIQKALKIIEQASPRCFKALETFTESLVLVDEPGIVSYSLQSLPGYSNINVVERDFVDLIDDLVHENGHHALNAYLNFEELIEEDDDKIFWSPWRRALRPIRGMYHGYLTFYWAYALFSDLHRNPSNELDQRQKEKVLTRFLEEFIMLDFCNSQLDHAFELEKILDEGMELVKEVRAVLESERSYVEKILASDLPKEVRAHLDALSTSLAEAKKQYLD